MQSSTPTSSSSSSYPGFVRSCIPRAMTQEQQNIIESLEQKGHTCVCYENYNDPPTVHWCESKFECLNIKTDQCDKSINRTDESTESMDQRHKEPIYLKNKLIADGDICVFAPEIYPTRSEWISLYNAI